MTNGPNKWEVIDTTKKQNTEGKVIHHFATIQDRVAGQDLEDYPHERRKRYLGV